MGRNCCVFNGRGSTGSLQGERIPMKRRSCAKDCRSSDRVVAAVVVRAQAVVKAVRAGEAEDLEDHAGEDLAVAVPSPAAVAAGVVAQAEDGVEGPVVAGVDQEGDHANIADAARRNIRSAFSPKMSLSMIGRWCGYSIRMTSVLESGTPILRHSRSISPTIRPDTRWKLARRAGHFTAMRMTSRFAD